MAFNPRTITKELDFANLAKHNDNYADIKTELDAHNAHIAAQTAHGSTAAATPGKIMQRDSAGRAKVAAPAAADDIARKAEVDAVQEALDDHIGDADVHLSEADRDKLDGIEAGAEPNQNAFAQVNNVVAASESDTLTIAGGTGITISTNPATKTVTVTATGEATPGPHGSSHDPDGSDPIPELVALRNEFDALTPASIGAETPAGAQAKVDALAGVGNTKTVAEVAEDVAGVTAQLAETMQVVNVMAYGAVGDGIADDTAAIQSAADALGDNGTLFFPANKKFRLTNTVNLPVGGKTITAYGATFLLDHDGVAFDLNPDADPLNIEATSQSYGFWFGGIFESTLTNPTHATALRFYGIRQMVIRDVRIGVHGTTRYKTGIEFAGLGGHLLEKVRFLYIDQCFYVPNWGQDGASSSVTTSTFNNNEFILAPNQFAFRVLGGWNRWRIYGGFSNAPDGCTVMYFNNNPIGGVCTNLIFEGVGFEQPGVGSKFIHLDDVYGSAFSNITFQNCSFPGDPSSGGVVAVDLENCRNVKISGSRFEQTTAVGNTSIRLDANCRDVEIDRSNYFSGPSIVSFAARRRITVVPEIERLTYLVLTGYDGGSFSSGNVTLDMKGLLGPDYPTQLPPLGYFVQIQARDSGSASSTSAGVEIMQESTTTSTKRLTLDLAGVPNNRRISKEGYVPADANGNIALQIYASGAGTLNLWIYIVGIHN